MYHCHARKNEHGESKQMMIYLGLQFGKQNYTIDILG